MTATITREPFTDPVSKRRCLLVIPPAGKIFPAEGEPKTGVAHPGCTELADLSLDLDAFFCPECKLSGRISGAWALDRIKAVRGNG